MSAPPVIWLGRPGGCSPLSERVAVAQELAYGPIIGWARRSPFHTGPMAHATQAAPANRVQEYLPSPPGWLLM